MRKAAFIHAILFLMVLAFIPPIVGAQQAEKKSDPFITSLHHTAKGMGFWYDKQNGGLETVTGVPYAELSCSGCHVETCSSCHGTEIDGKPAYSAAAAKEQSRCLECHAREGAVMNVDKAQNHTDVHAALGMQCMDCHSATDVHGDGTEYASMKQPGAMSATCESCHEKISKNVSHVIHHGKLDCKACHVRHAVSCTNCHFETMVKEGKRVAVPVSGWLFLMNYQGKVTSANMQTFVAPGEKTFLLFAPQFPHSVMAKGRTCEECHATEAVAQARAKRVKLLWLEGGEVRQAKGVIPVAEGAKYELVFQNFANGKWSVIDHPAEPPIQYVGYGTPLSAEQMDKLAKPRHGK